MKIINEKGKLFGRVNIIDFLVIIFLLFLTPTFYFGYQLFTKRTACLKEANQKEFGTIEINCDLIKLNPETLKIIMQGDTEKNKKGEIIGTILWIGKSQPVVYLVNVGQIQDNVQDAVLRQLPAKLKIKVEIKNKNLYYNDQHITTSQPFYFRTNKYVVKCTPFINNEISNNKILENKNVGGKK